MRSVGQEILRGDPPGEGTLQPAPHRRRGGGAERENKELFKLVRWSEDSGAMWVHMLLTTSFNDP